MNKNAMILLECVGAGAVVGMISGFINDARKHKASEVKNDVYKEYEKEISDIAQDYERALNRVEEISAKEQETFLKELGRVEPIDISTVQNNLKEKLDITEKDLKQAMKFDERIKVIEDEAVKEWNEALRDMNYQSNYKAANREIDKANREYNKAKNIIDLAGPDEDTAKALKKAAKKARNEAIEEQKAILEDLKDEYESRREEIQKEKLSKVRDIRKEFNERFKEAKVSYEAELKRVNEVHEETVANIRQRIFDERSEEDIQAIELSRELRDELDKAKAARDLEADKLVESFTVDDAIASYLKERNISKGEVTFVCILPWIPVLHVGYLYFKRVKNVLDKM